MEVPEPSNNINIPKDQEPQPPCTPCPPCVTHVIMQTHIPKRKWSIVEYAHSNNIFDSKSHTPSTSVTKTI